MSNPFETRPIPTTIEVPVHILEDDRATISRSKLEHLKDLSEDERLSESPFNIDNFLAVISQGVFFASLGACFSFSNLSRLSQVFCLSGIISGGILSCYFQVKIYKSSKSRNMFRTKLTTHISNILEKLDQKSAQKS